MINLGYLRSVHNWFTRISYIMNNLVQSMKKHVFLDNLNYMEFQKFITKFSTNAYFDNVKCRAILF
jgi:hypothetical protein